MLYNRDYRILTNKEKDQLEKIEQWFDETQKLGNGGVSAKNFVRYGKAHTFAMWCYKSLFPNNYLSAHKFSEKQKLNNIVYDFRALLDKGCNEREILNFIREQQSYYIISSILKRYSTGHHDAYLFKEFELPPSYKSDYLVVGKSSLGFEFIFIECESSTGSITNKNGDWGYVVRKGLKQIEDWNAWIETNYSHLKLVFESKCKPGELLPKEFYELDKSRIHFAIIAGRRSDFSEKTYRLRRKGMRDSQILILHYDNLIDSALKLIEWGQY